jgi:hypothetical protein
MSQRKRQVFWAFLSPTGALLPSTIRVKGGDSECALGGMHRYRENNEECTPVQVRIFWGEGQPGEPAVDQDAQREVETQHQEISACYAILTEALGHIEVDINPGGQAFQDKLVAFLIERGLYQPPSDSI